MAPPIEAFPASELLHRVNVLPNGRRRKGEDIDLKKCDLLELVQYSCHLKGDPKSRQAVIQCEPVVKLFRRYVDSALWRNCHLTCKFRCVGDLMVETTALEAE